MHGRASKFQIENLSPVLASNKVLELYLHRTLEHLSFSLIFQYLKSSILNLGMLVTVLSTVNIYL